ncbi:MAG: hypothetical protein ACJ75K_28225, partial [Actinomycetes bacterium]
MDDEATSHQWIAGNPGSAAHRGAGCYRGGGPGASQGNHDDLETAPDPFLTEACGVEVTTTATGRITFLDFPDRPVGPQDLTTVNVAFVATAGDNQRRFRDVGIDLVRVEPDGTVILSTVGQIPFGFTGV